MKTTINFRGDEELKEILENEAELKRISLSEHVRRLVEGFYDNNNSKKTKFSI
jgi:predicted HicB family RNase H-like nuclease